nr:efflux RND transporter periplasmic adaptor subunit [Pseudoalteromonas luteoviolacea]
MMSAPVVKIVIAMTVGMVIGAGVVTLLDSQHTMVDTQKSAADEKKPLYWVAPMDANYRRDQPGKSPMGMDLVPVYEESQGEDKFGPGVVKISPHVVNNLGVRTAKVTLGALQQDINTVGYVQYDEHRLVHIHPRVDGWVDNLYVKAVGDEVEQGQALYDLYSPELVNAQKEMLVALNQADQQLIEAATKRLRALKMSTDFIEQLIKTKQVRQTVTFYTPQSGVVKNLKIREGYYVQPGTTMMSIGQLDHVWVEVEVFEREASLIKVGLPVEMTLDYLPNRSWQGQVDYVYPSLDASNRTLRVRLKFSNIDKALKPNMFARVQIKPERTQNTLLVPKESVIRTGAQNRVVLALGEGQFKSVAVEIGRIDETHIEIISGLNEDETVVTSAQFLIDSESSKSSDFKRMTFDDKPKSVWMQGEVHSVTEQSRQINVTHGPVDAWNWPEMTMDFDVGQEVDLDALKAGQTLHFEVTQLGSGSYQVTGIHIMAEPHIPMATVKGVINHVSHQDRTVNISREAIEKWNRAAATMDFVVDESLPLADFKVAQEITFTFEVRDDLVIVDIKDVNSGEHNAHAGH